MVPLGELWQGTKKRPGRTSRPQRCDGKKASGNRLCGTDRGVARLAVSHLGKAHNVVVLGKQRGKGEDLEAIAGLGAAEDAGLSFRDFAVAFELVRRGLGHIFTIERLRNEL